MNHSRRAFVLLAIAWPQLTCAQTTSAWKVVPKVVVIASSADDPRFDLVDAAVAHWNGIFVKIGSSFRLGHPERIVGPPPEAALQERSKQILEGVASPFNLPSALRDLPGDLRIVLGDSSFISFSGPFDLQHRRTLGIRAADTPPLSLPNVALNVIAHELGHAIGLGHNSDFAALMCGRPASCRPTLYQSVERKLFPLLESEQVELLAMYPPNWRASR